MFRNMRGFVLVHRIDIAVARRRSDGVVVIDDIRDREAFDGLGAELEWADSWNPNVFSCTVVFDARSISWLYCRIICRWR